MAGETELTPTVNLQGYLTQETFLYIIFWFAFILGLVLVIVVLGFGIWYMTYRIKVRYYESIGIDKNGKIIPRFMKTDKAKLVKLRGGIYNIRYFWKRKKDEPPPAEAYVPTKKGFELHVLTDGVDFHPMKLRTNPGFEIVPMHKRLWLIQTNKQAMEQYSKPSFWDKYGTLILTFGTVILCLGAMTFAIWYAGKLGQHAIDVYSPQIGQAIQNGARVAPGI